MIAILTVFALLAAPASAQLDSAVVFNPAETIRPASGPRLEYRLGLVTGSAPANVRVGFRRPSFDPGVAGSPLKLGDPRLEGPGSLGIRADVTPDFVSGTCFKAFYPGGIAFVDVALPANARSALVVPVRVARLAPWPETDYRLGFRIAGRTVRAPAPRILGKRGVRIRLSTPPPGGEANAPTEPRFVRVAGRTLPVLRNRRIVLRAARNNGSPRPFARVRTDRRGRFSARALFSRRGNYIVTAAFAGSRRYARSVSCAGGFAIDGR